MRILRGVNILKNAAILANDMALTFPEGFWAEAGRKASSSYFNAYRNAKFDPEIGKADEKGERGNRRRSYLNNGFRKLGGQWPDSVEVTDVCMGLDNGSNNHVELKVGKYVVTHHHLTGGKLLPDGSFYLVQNTGLNEELEQRELIPLRTYMPEEGFSKPFNLLVLHREDPESPSDIGSIELVFANGRKRLATFTIEEIVKIQAKIAEMAPEELFDFKFRHEEEKRKHGA